MTLEIGHGRIDTPAQSTLLPFTRTFIISDLHNKWPYSSENPALKVDVFIHCGDLTQYGGPPSFQRAINSIKTVDAEVKLVIAGNHNIDIDQAWLDEFAEDEDDVEIGAKYEISFTVYATPYTPKFGEFAFLYGDGEDRFNEGLSTMSKGVDIVISHGCSAATVNWGPKELEFTIDGTSMSRTGEGVETLLVNADIIGDGKRWLMDLNL
ncbi:uncharacterized protein M421DRAFT_399951 [Didymella exigua CBS 183.55]|uniref:Calcineurin-like phosphoesterase domain-containing protein n=1 Tax=Didymella exigua CBS 183.55 TaxID=1150837 RepID=A0A6A5RCD3_9PLEO|nr:uncharacterized protein M421DRAFT_399951 [Didymella exigua CBS 183.55]KAF1925342.1 hypothetical protein M421DRAFT_399951 [Didymella exigua CBS 183.55]